MRAGFPDFRLGNVLSTSFTGTLSERHGDAVERIPTPERLADWLAVNGLAVDSCTTAQLELARELRESIHAAATAAATQDALPASAVQIINDCSARGRAAAVLTPEGERRWQLGSASCVEDALGVIAADAISIIAGERDTAFDNAGAAPNPWRARVSKCWKTTPAFRTFSAETT